jgi:pimeloyl-ACP methyl ester carboxylesterase
MDEVRAVMEAVGGKRAAFLGYSEGGPMCILFAATYPQRTQSVVVIGPFARRLQASDYPHGHSLRLGNAFIESNSRETSPLGRECR